jgi:hypothetical protein
MTTEELTTYERRDSKRQSTQESMFVMPRQSFIDPSIISQFNSCYGISDFKPDESLMRRRYSKDFSCLPLIPPSLSGLDEDPEAQDSKIQAEKSFTFK